MIENKQKKKGFFLGIIFFIIISSLIFLNRTYAHIYNTIGMANLKSVDKEGAYLIGNPESVQKITYVALGDSLTSGVGASQYSESYPYLLANYLAKDQAQIDLKDYSVPGARTEDILNNFLAPALNEDSNIITLLIGVNDIHNQVSASDFKANYAKILAHLKNETKADVYAISIPYIGADTLIMPPYNYYFNYKTKKFNEIIKKLAVEYKVNYVDLYTPTLSLFKKTGDHYSVDLFHPSASGYALWGKIIYDSINK